jgi:hypothetical protein
MGLADRRDPLYRLLFRQRDVDPAQTIRADSSLYPQALSIVPQ